MNKISSFSWRLVKLLVPAIALVGTSGNLYGQFEVPDTLRFDPVTIYYPGQPDTGAMKAELRWSTASGGLPTMQLGVLWTGAIVCDSFVPEPNLVELLDTVVAFIDNDIARISIVHDQSLSVPYPADYKYGDLYWTIQDTGVVAFSGHVEFLTVPGMIIEGTWIPSSFYISNPGDFDNDGIAGNIADVVYLIGYIFGTEPVQPTPFADINGDCVTNISDVVYLIRYLFAEGPGPMPGCEF